MKSWLLTLFILLDFTGTTLAQTNTDFIRAMDSYRSNKMAGSGVKELTLDDITGSPYLVDDFINGSVFTNSEIEYLDIPLRYNIYSDAMEFKTEKNEVLLLDTPEMVKKIEFGEYKVVYAPFSESKKIQRGYFIVLVEGKVSLYTKPKIEFIKATLPAGYQEATPAKFERKPDSFYVRVGMDEAKLVENKKDLLEIIPDQKEKLEEFIKLKKTRFNKAEGLTELIRYYNSL